MKRQYLVRIDKDVDSDWGASVPDLPGCVATGKTIDVALRRIESAIELHLRGLHEDGNACGAASGFPGMHHPPHGYWSYG